jgi:hypothetical protein
MQGDVDQIVTLNFKIPDYDLIDEAIEGFKDERQKKRRTSPLIRGYKELPRVRDLKKTSKQNAAHNPTYRQLWFQKHVLIPITKERGQPCVPWQFRTKDGTCWRLDKGSVAHAMNQSMLVRPSDPDQVLTYVTYVESTHREDADHEVQRRKRLGKIASRPDQKKFSETLRHNYGGQCAVTGCTTAEALEAAHIRTLNGSRDDNDPSNGILLRADIHALLDSHLITISEDTTQIEISDKLTDEFYKSLNGKRLLRPSKGPAPSRKNVKAHRLLFQENAHELLS